MRTLVVGASAAGLRAAETLVRGGRHAGHVTVLSTERTPPYDRTAVSKGLLTGSLTADEAALSIPPGVEVRLGVTALGLDLAWREVVTDERRERFDQLVIATGAIPVAPPPWMRLSGVHALRTAADAATLRHRLTTARIAVVVGAGVLGLEVATALAGSGHRVTVLEGARYPLRRVLPATLATDVLCHVASCGIRLLPGVEVVELVGQPAVSGARLADGRVIPADVVVLALGSRANDRWLAGSGLTTRDGVVCDDHLRAGPPGVFAAGDVARYPASAGTARTTRCEHWTRAAGQGRYVADLLLGEVTGPFCDVPYVWSDMLGTRLQVVGLLDGDEAVQVRQDQRTAVLVRSGDRIVGAATLAWQRLGGRLRTAVTQRWDWERALELLP